MTIEATAMQIDALAREHRQLQLDLEQARATIAAADALAAQVETFGAAASLQAPAVAGPLLAACAAYRAVRA